MTTHEDTRPAPGRSRDEDRLRAGRVPPRIETPDGTPVERLHVAARLEDRFDAAVAHVLRRRGWTVRVVGYAGYGTAGHVRVMARTLLASPAVRQRDLPEAGADAQTGERAADAVRGWRSFFTAPVAGAPLEVTVGGRTHRLETDRGGYVDAWLESDLPPGWHDVTITSLDGASTTTRVVVVGPEPTVGIVSDVDDTVMVTRLPRPLVAAWNVFVRHENAREVVPGMARLYRELRATAREDSPVVYLSTGAWNAAPAIGRFLRRHDYPGGPLLLTDWGPTNTGLFRSGQRHKVAQLRRLFAELPQVRWILVGDDGQHDPQIYAGAAQRYPERIRAVLIRQLTAGEHVLSSGLPVAAPEQDAAAEDADDAPGVEVVLGADGEELLRHVRERGLVPPGSSAR